MSNQSKDMLYQMTMQFLTFLAAKANTVCANKNKKTIFPEHVQDALNVSLIAQRAGYETPTLFGDFHGKPAI